MKRSNFIVIALVAVVILVIGFAVMNGGKSADNATTNGARNNDHTDMNKPATAEQQPATGEAQMSATVNIEEFEFKPKTIKVKKGGSVTWTNKDTAKHDISPDKPTDEFKASELLAKGESYSVTFNTVGSYSYNCSPHPYMKGMVEVVE